MLPGRGVASSFERNFFKPTGITQLSRLLHAACLLTLWECIVLPSAANDCEKAVKLPAVE